MCYNVVGNKELLEAIELSPLSLAHFELLCDSVGIRQHAIHGIPMLESGYTVDDNARALVAMLDFGELFDKKQAGQQSIKFLSLLNFMQLPSGWFRNLLSFDRRFLDEGGSDDSFGRAVWAAGKAVNSWLGENSRINAQKMLEKALPFVDNLEEPRSISFSLLGLVEFARVFPEKEWLFEKIGVCAEKLVAMLEKNSDAEWQWFEDTLTYDNARMPQALFAAFQATGNQRFLDAAEKSFSFLSKCTIKGELFEPVGQNGWFPKGGKKAVFDQQPIEAASMVQAATAGFFATSDEEYKKAALVSFSWFFGGNRLGAALYDKETGACFDGLTFKEVNLNQGAESMLEFMLARFCIERMKRQKI